MPSNRTIDRHTFLWIPLANTNVFVNMAEFDTTSLEDLNGIFQNSFIFFRFQFTIDI